MQKRERNAPSPHFGTKGFLSERHPKVGLQALRNQETISVAPNSLSSHPTLFRRCEVPSTHRPIRCTETSRVILAALYEYLLLGAESVLEEVSEHDPRNGVAGRKIVAK